jgi:hypothetical protein
LAWRFDNGNAQHLAANPSTARATLRAGEVDERLIRYGLDEAIAQ